MGAGIAYRLDLLNEGLPMSGQTALQDYATRLWADYTAAFGKADTVGFSMTVWIADRVRQMPAVYGGNLPDVFDVHLYGDGHNGDEYEQFVAAHAAMRDLGYTQGWIIGEAYYDDSTAAAGIRRAINETGRTVFYLTQWPLGRADRCGDRTIDVACRFRQWWCRAPGTMLRGMDGDGFGSVLPGGIRGSGVFVHCGQAADPGRRLSHSWAGAPFGRSA